MERTLKQYEYVEILLRKTKSGEIKWTDGGGGLYTGTFHDAQLRFYPFQIAVRSPSYLILEVVEGYTKREIREPEPHISAVPLGKLWYYTASIWNFLFSFIWIVSVPPREPETREEIEN